MAKFAQYYITYLKDNLFAHLAWAERQERFGEFFIDDSCITFSDKSIPEGQEVPEGEKPEEPEAAEGEKKKKVKIYKHRIYHLKENKDIIVMRLANVKIIPIEKDFKPEQVEHYPSVFIVIDNRGGCRRIAIQKLSTSFSNTDTVAKILQKTLGDAMMSKWHIGLEFRAQRYTMDFYKLWRSQQHHTARIKFNISPDEDSRARLEAQQKRQLITGESQGLEPLTEMDESILGHIYSLEEESDKAGYGQVIELYNKKGPVMYVDETSAYIRNLARYSSSTATPIEIITTDGGSFECFVNTDMESDDKIVTQEFDASYLEALFDNQLEDETRKTYETKVVEFLYSMKLVVDDDEKETSAV